MIILYINKGFLIQTQLHSLKRDTKKADFIEKCACEVEDKFCCKAE